MTHKPLQIKGEWVNVDENAVNRMGFLATKHYCREITLKEYLDLREWLIADKEPFIVWFDDTLDCEAAMEIMGVLFGGDDE